jgi:hypothetical protein
MSSVCLLREPTCLSNDVNIWPWSENRAWRFLTLEVRRCGRDWAYHEVVRWHSPVRFESSARTTFGRSMSDGRSCQRSFARESNQFTKIRADTCSDATSAHNKHYTSKLCLAEHYRVSNGVPVTRSKQVYMKWWWKHYLSYLDGELILIHKKILSVGCPSRANSWSLSG